MVACRGNKLVGSTLDWFVSHFQKNQLDRRTPLREEEDRTGHLVCLDYFYIPFMVNRRVKRAFFRSDVVLESFTFDNERVILSADRQPKKFIGFIDLHYVSLFGFLPFRHNHLGIINVSTDEAIEDVIVYAKGTESISLGSKLNGLSPQMCVYILKALGDELKDLRCSMTFLDEPEIPTMTLNTLKLTVPARHGGMISCLRQRPKRIDLTDYEDFALNAIVSNICEFEPQESVEILTIRLVKDTSTQTITRLFRSFWHLCPNLHTVEVVVDHYNLSDKIRQFCVPEYFFSTYGPSPFLLNFKIKLEINYERVQPAMRLLDPSPPRSVRLWDPLALNPPRVNNFKSIKCSILPGKGRSYQIMQATDRITAETTININIPEFYNPDMVDINPPPGINPKMIIT